MSGLFPWVGTSATRSPPCLQCGTEIIGWDLDETRVLVGRAPRLEAECGRCGAVHRALIDSPMYALVRPGSPLR